VLSHPQDNRAGIAILTPVSSVAEASEAVRAGARLVDAGTDEALVAAIQQADLGVLVCGPGAAADLGRDYGNARAQLLCAGPAVADLAVENGIARDRIIIQVTAEEVAAVAQAGWRTLVDVDVDVDVELAGLVQADGAGPGSIVARAGAIAAVCAWLGVSVIGTRYVAEIRRCLDMTESIRGTRPPAWAVRGLG
jgi:hypothetical protein